VELETHGFHDFFKESPPLKTVLKQEEEQHGFHNSDKNSPPREKATILSFLQKPRSIAGIITFLIIIISLLMWNLHNSRDGSDSSKENLNDIIKSSTNIPAKPNLERVDLAVEREKRRKKIDSINTESNRIANVAIGDMPKGSINVDTLMRVYKKIASDSAELGLIHANYLIDLKNQLILEREQKKDQIKWDKTKAGKIQKEHPKWSKEDCEKVANNIIWIGMSIEMLYCERGSPNSANPSDYGDGVQWQWCWSYKHPSCFYGGEDGIITSYN